MDEAKAKEMLRRWGASAEECSRLQQALTCLRKVTGLGKECLLSPRTLLLPVLPGLASSFGRWDFAKAGLGIARLCFRVWG